MLKAASNYEAATKHRVAPEDFGPLGSMKSTDAASSRPGGGVEPLTSGVPLGPVGKHAPAPIRPLQEAGSV
ncbi:MAG: hypothetical protein WDO56_20820 [Gammaproteobacteria bacterium]